MRKSLINRYEHLLPDGFSFTTTITLSAACNAHPMTYVPINYRARLGESKIRPRHAYDFTLLIVRTMVFFNPLKVFLPLGAVMAAGALAKLVYDITKDNLSETAVLGILGALIVWAVGLWPTRTHASRPAGNDLRSRPRLRRKRGTTPRIAGCLPPP
jgi:hypothetical protein